MLWKKGSDQVDVDVGEPALRDGNWEGFDLDMPVDLGLLALSQSLVHAAMSLLMPAQTNLEHKSRFVASLPGCAMLWMLLKTARR